MTTPPANPMSPLTMSLFKMTSFLDLNTGPDDTLYKLPTEIRLMVYELVLVHHGIISVDLPAKNRLAIMRTCKLYHEEACAVFYGKNHFLISDIQKPTLYKTILSPISARYLNLLKHITISIITGHPRAASTKRKANMISGLARTGVELNRLTIVLGSDLPCSVSLFFDDSLMAFNHPITRAILDVIHGNTAKDLRIRLDKARFETHVARDLQAAFEDVNGIGGRSLSFFVNPSYTARDVVGDLKVCEKEAKGVYVRDPVDLIVPQSPLENVRFGDLFGVMEDVEVGVGEIGELGALALFSPAVL